MELIYPLVVYIGIPAIIILVFIKVKSSMSYNKGKKIANTKYIEEIPYYKELMKKYKIVSYIIKALCVLAILISLLLIARPSIINTSDSSMYNRDIFLCMDISTSVDELNEKLVESLKETVKSLKGERFGITIFNTSSVVLVPLTDDYEYVINVLDNINKALKGNNNYDYSDESLYMMKYIESGTLVGNETRGSSIIGDGLASCIYNFSNLEENRTRIIIFSTDNDLEGEEIVTLQEAAQISKSKNITVFGIAPKATTEKNATELRQAVETTGGSYYTEDYSVKEIVKEIEKKGKSLIKGQKEIKKIDVPQIPFVILVISILALFILNKKVNL